MSEDDGIDPELFRFRHWQSDALTTRLDRIPFLCTQYLGHLANDELPPLVELAEAADLDVVLVDHPELEIVEVVERADLVNDVEATCAVVAQDAVERHRISVKVVLVILIIVSIKSCKCINLILYECMTKGKKILKGTQNYLKNMSKKSAKILTLLD